MRSSKSSSKTPRKDKKIASPNDSSLETKISGTPENRSCRPKTWIAGGAVIMLLALIGLIVHHGQEKENREKIFPTPEHAEKSTPGKTETHELASLSTETPPETMLDTVRALEHRLRTLEKIHERASQIWDACHRLITASSGESSFEKELNTFKELASPNAKIAKAIEWLEAYARTGVPTFETLVKNFDEVKKEILNGSVQNLAGWQKIKLSLMNLIEIRRTDERKEMSSAPVDIVQQALSHMNEKNFEQAISLLSPLKRDNTPMLGTWLVHAQARQDIMKGQEFLKNQIFPEMMSPQ